MLSQCTQMIQVHHAVDQQISKKTTAIKNANEFVHNFYSFEGNFSLHMDSCCNQKLGKQFDDSSDFIWTGAIDNSDPSNE